MINKAVNSFIMGMVFMPLIALFFWSIKAGFSEVDSSSFIQILISIKLLNSLILAFLVSLFSSILALLIAMLFYHIESLVFRKLFLFILLFMFATSPLVYTSLFSEISAFSTLSPLLRSVIILTLWLSSLASGILILMMRYLDQLSLDILKFMNISKFKLFKILLLKQLYLPLVSIFFLLFMMVFVQEEVPSFFGYRTYAEEFLSRIILMENFESTLFYAIPFIVLALGSSILFYAINKKNVWKIFHNLIIPLDKLTLIPSSKIVYFMLIIFVSISLFIFVSLAKKIEYTMFFTLCNENIFIFFHSFFLSLSAAFFATILSIYFVNYFFYSNSKMIIFIAFLSLYWLLPSSLTALVLLKFSQIFYNSSDLLAYIWLLYGYILRVLPVAMVMIMIVYRHNGSDDLLRLVKISKWRSFFAITLPMQWKKWIVVMSILFFLVLNEITITILLVPPGFETLVVKIYNLMHYGDFHTVAFLSILQSMLIAMVLFLLASVGAFYDKH